MASIERTAYPRFKKQLDDDELKKLYDSNEEEIIFIRRNAKGDCQQLTLLTLLKTHQQLGYLPSLQKVPQPIREFLCTQLKLPNDTSLLYATQANKKTFYRYRQAIRSFLNIQPYTDGGGAVAQNAIEKAAYTMSDPADLINVAIETLVQNRFELPAFSALDRMVGRIRQEVHERLYESITSTLTDAQRRILDGLLEVRENKRLTDFNRIKQVPGRATLKRMKLWSLRLQWLTSIISPEHFVREIPHTKVRQFAAETNALEAGDMKDIHRDTKRHALLICFIYQAQIQTRDQLVTIFLKRMRRTHNAANKKLEDLKDKHRELEEQMMEALSQVIDCASDEPADYLFGRNVRKILDDYGGVEMLAEQYKQVSAYHHKNYLPLLWNIHKPHRTAILDLLNTLDIDGATQDKSLIRALRFLQKYNHVRRDYLPNDIELEFASQRWKNFVQTKHKGKKAFKRRELEICILSFIADGLRCADLYVNGSEEFSDYRQQLLPWEECEKRLDSYCQALELPQNADDFVTSLQQKLRLEAEKADKFFPANTELTIDEDGKPHLKRIKADTAPEGMDEFKENVRQRMPEHNLLDVLKNVQYWVNFTRHFTPPSGSDPKMQDAVSRYLFTVFGHGCNLGATQTARHAQEEITLRVLKRINDQHITTPKLELAIQDVINEYAEIELPFLWGSGKAAIADGTHVELVENNLMGERHIRYGGYGGIAYHHISDTYIALFSHFIACGVWEAVYILDGLMKNRSKLQPDTVHADTQGQSEPVFGLAYLLGIMLMPRMRTWDDVAFYRPDNVTIYKHIDRLFTKTVNWNLIRKHWKDLMQVVLSIQAGKVMPSMLLQKLGVHNRKNKLYRAFQELGRVLRTVFLLQYVSNQPMRKEIRAATTKIESFHAFRDWVSFGGQIITSGDPLEQEKRIKYMNLVANSIMLHNVVDLTKVLNRMMEEGYQVTPELAQGLSPYMTEQLKRFGQYFLDIDNKPEPLKLPKLAFVQA